MKGVMDDESGEFMERAELVCIGRSESKMERLAQGCRGEKQGVHSRNEVRHSEERSVICKRDDERGWERVTTDEERVRR